MGDSVESISESSASNKIAQKGIKGGGCALDNTKQHATAVKKPSKVSNDAKQSVSINKRPQKEAVIAPKQMLKPQTSSAWHDTIAQLKLGGRAAELIKHCLLESYENGTILLLIEASSAGLLADSVQAEIQSALSDFYGKEVRLNLSVSSEETKVVETNGNQSNETPAQRSARITAEIQQQAEQNITKDPFVIELQNRFGAQVVPGSVSPK